MIESLAFILGFSWILGIILTISNYLKALIFAKEPKLIPGTWAIVTACTDGIGKGFAESLAKRGLNIVQVGRNPEKLLKCARDMNAKYGVEVKNIVKDFSLCHLDPINFFQDIYDQTKGLDVRILVNNVGTAIIKEFAKQTTVEIENQLSLNIFPVVFLSRLYEKDIRNKENSWIINLSSAVTEGYLKGFIIYCSSKSFDLNFTEVLVSEGSHAVALQPGLVETPLTEKIPSRPLLISASDCSEATLKNLGVVNVTSGHWKHVFAVLGVKCAKPLIRLT
jgi:17beta-estradiol 17-dehydrogenase / very-long-chain 3-oxoacyl-CoA reductase